MCASVSIIKQRGLGSVLLGAAVLGFVGSAQTSVAHAQYLTPPVDGTFDYQLHQRYAVEDESVSIISSDGDISSDPNQAPAANAPLDSSRYNICYVNVLQTQPDPADGAYWLATHPELILANGGQAVIDPDWPDEMLFDISTPENREALLQLELPWIEQCRAAGFQAIEPDNIDSFQRSLGRFDAQASAAFMTGFVAAAHQAGLAVGQKNVAEWAAATADGTPNLAAQVGFDFAIVEECQLTGECPELVDHYGAGAVFDIEYWYDEDYTLGEITVPAFTRDHFDRAYSELAPGVRVVLRNRDVRPAGAEGHQFAVCIAQVSAPTAGTVEPITTEPGETETTDSEPEGDPEP